MSRSYVGIRLAWCALVLAGAALSAESWVVEGCVVAVADGDTITILDCDKR